jgi:hypothetical protein
MDPWTDDEPPQRHRAAPCSRLGIGDILGPVVVLTCLTGCILASRGHLLAFIATDVLVLIGVAVMYVLDERDRAS